VPRKLTDKQEKLLREYAQTESHDNAVLPETGSFWKRIKDYLSP
jgi:hypothetical protein